MFRNSSTTLKIEDILEVEEKTKLSFPDDLKQFYLFSNGGELSDERCVFIDAEDNDYLLKSFLPIKYPRLEDDVLLEYITVDFIKRNLIPTYFIVIAIDWGGFPFCYNLKNGAIYFVNIESDDLDKSLVCICPSLTDFINNLIKEEEAY